MTDARFVLSAASASDFPKDGLPEVALVGRSNVGKSSLINALVKKRIARTSAAPGKTRLANYYLIESPIPNPKSLYLVDLPGYGYARGGTTASEAFERLAGEYFTGGRRIAGVLHLIDARHPDLPQDAAAHDWLVTFHLPLAVVATKADNLGRAERIQMVRRFETTYPGPVLFVSAFKHEGMAQVLKVVAEWNRV